MRPLARRADRTSDPKMVIVPVLAMLAISGVLILKQPDMGTALVLIDELHNLDLGTRSGAEASDQIKYLSERIPATFVLAGVEIEGTGLFAGHRG